MDKERLMVLLDEFCQKNLPILSPDEMREGIVNSILSTLGYAWQDGQEADVIAMLKEAINC